jgi:hypothetical protein
MSQRDAAPEISGQNLAYWQLRKEASQLGLRCHTRMAWLTGIARTFQLERMCRECLEVLNSPQSIDG